MTDEQTISWIFLAIALASQKEAANFSGISIIADGINHAVPTQKEMQKSILYLRTNDLVRKQSKKYDLTTKAKLYTRLIASDHSKTLLEVWKKLEESIEVK